MPAKRILATILFLVMALSCLGAAAEGLEPLPMDTYAPGPVPRDENFLSDMEYEDESISVKIYQGRYADTDYVYAHIKIADPSQLRTAPAAIVNSAKGNFKSSDTGRGRYVAKAVNAVISINGDYYTKTDKCKVVLRQSQQVRNAANGDWDLLVIDKNGDLYCLRGYSKQDYADYYAAHADEMYQVFCFGPMLILDGQLAITEQEAKKRNEKMDIGVQNSAQRSAIAQLGPLEYMIITCSSEQASDYEDKRPRDKGMTLMEFAQACLEAGYSLSENGCLICFNLDGGNSATMNFKRWDAKTGKLLYAKINPGQERFLGDIIYFATLVK